MSGFPVIPQAMKHSMVTKAMPHADQGFGFLKRVMIVRAGTICKTMAFKHSFTNRKPEKTWSSGN